MWSAAVSLQCTFAAVLFVALPACDRGPAGSAAAPARFARSILLVTIDGIRVDRLGCSGYRDARTPTLDALAAAGVMFERAYTQAPLTMPAHAAILTGRYPRELGTRVDGRGALATDVPTLATLADHWGLKTAAFVANRALGAPYGLGRGFHAYDDEIERPAGDAEPLSSERPADGVTDRALAWLQSAAAGGDPLFCWVHYSDPRAPHEPPPDFRAAARTPYDGELAFVDAQLKRLVDWLDQADRTASTLVVVVGASGQPPGEPADTGAGLLLHESNIRVPWLLAFSDVVGHGRRIPQPVELTSLLPTVVALMGWEPLPTPAPALLPAVLGAGDPPLRTCYSESAEAFRVHRWAEQRAIIDGPWKYISSTRPALYNLVEDPGEHHDLALQRAEVAAELERKLRERYAGMSPGDAPSPDPAASAAAASRSPAAPIGDEFLTRGALEPRDMLPTLERLRRIPRMLQEQQQAAAVGLAREAVTASPGSPALQRLLGDTCLQAGDVESAVAALTQAAELDAGDPRNLVCLADALTHTGDLQRAAELYAAARELQPADVETHVKLARVAVVLEQNEAALAGYRTAVELDPRHVDAAMELLALHQQLQTPPLEVVAYFEQQANARRHNPGPRYNLGVALAAAERYADAIPHLSEVLRIDPNFGHAYNKLGICAARLGRTDEAVANFTKAKNYEMSRAEAWFNSGVALGQQGRAADAIQAYEQALKNRPAYPSAITALTRLYFAARDLKSAVRVLRDGVAACPTDVRMLTTLADILASCSDANLRNGPEALRHAQRARALLGGREPPGLLMVLAAAEAETGDFSAAVSTARRARAAAEAQGQRDLAAVIARQLESLERGQPYRNPRY